MGILICNQLFFVWFLGLGLEDKVPDVETGMTVSGAYNLDQHDGDNVQVLSSLNIRQAITLQ